MVDWKTTVNAFSYNNPARNRRVTGSVAGISLLAAAVASAGLSETLIHSFGSSDRTPLVVLKPHEAAIIAAPISTPAASTSVAQATTPAVATWNRPVYVRRVNAMPATATRVANGASTHAMTVTGTTEISSADADWSAPAAVEGFVAMHAPAATAIKGAMFADASWIDARANGGWSDEAQADWSFVASDAGRPEIVEADLAQVAPVKANTPSANGKPTKSTGRGAKQQPTVTQQPESEMQGDLASPTAVASADGSQSPVARPVNRIPSVVIPPIDMQVAVGAGTPLSYDVQVDTGGGGDRFIIPPQAGLIHGVGSLGGGSVVPEPTTLLGLAFVGALTRRKRR